MKATIPQFKIAFAAFTDELVRCVEDKFRRALVGAKMVAVNKALAAALDERCQNGMVDIGEIREYVDGAIKPCDGEIPYRMEFVVMGVKIADPIDFIIRQADIDKFFNKTLPAICGTPTPASTTTSTVTNTTTPQGGQQ